VPALQIGANVYCDTAVIAVALARHTGDQTLFAPGFTAGRVAEWADGTLFRITVAINFRPEAVSGFMSRLSAEEVAAFQADRAALAGDAPLVSVPPDAAISAFQAYLAQLDGSLADNFLFGDTPSIADFSVYHCLWFVAQNPVSAGLIEPYPAVGTWMSRMAAFGHGTVTESNGEEALAHARETDPVLPKLDNLAVAGIEPGQLVSVTPTDYGKIPVTGTLAALNDSEIIVERETPETGPVMTHFPNIGFQITPA
jgi:glutathione S-transferase